MGKASQDKTKTTPSSNKDCHDASKTHMIDLMTMIHLTFTTHLHVPTDLCLTFFLYKPRRIFSTLKTAFETLIHCLPRVGFTEINPFLVLPSLSLSAFGFRQWRRAEPGLLGTSEARCSCTPESQLYSLPCSLMVTDVIPLALTFVTNLLLLCNQRLSPKLSYRVS